MGRKSKIISEIKIIFVEDYLAGNTSLNRISKELKVNTSSVRAWVRKYTTFGPEGLITKNNNTVYTSDIDNTDNYNLAANKYNVSYQQAYTWVKKYNKDGYDALVDRRGKNKDFEDLSELEKFSAQINLLEAKNRRLKMENDFFKKLEEIERR